MSSNIRTGINSDRIWGDVWIEIDESWIIGKRTQISDITEGISGIIKEIIGGLNEISDEITIINIKFRTIDTSIDI